MALMTAGHWHRRRIVTATRKQFVHFSLESLALHQALSRRGGILRWSTDERWRTVLDRSAPLWGPRFALQPAHAPTLRWALEGALQHTIATWLVDAPTTLIDGPMARAVEYLDRHAHARPSVALIAKVAGLSERRLAERFHETSASVSLPTPSSAG